MTQMITTEYYIKRTSRGTFQIAKFEETDWPTRVYDLKETRQGLDCTCQGTRHHRYACKHVNMIAEFKKAGEPIPFILLL